MYHGSADATGLCKSFKTQRLGACCKAGRARDLSCSTRPSGSLARKGACHWCRCLCAKSRRSHTGLYSGVGYQDDLMVLSLGTLAVAQLIPPEILAEHRATAAMALEKADKQNG